MRTQKVYIALLRGINVGGNKVILMADLKKTFENLGFSGVTTYIQSGNVVFVGDGKSAQEFEGEIKDAIKLRFKFDVEVLVLEFGDLERIISNNPFGKRKLGTGERIYFTILSSKPGKEKVGEIYKIKNDVDEIKVIDKTVYVLCRKGYAKSLYNNGAIEKVLGLKATSRNLETMNKLVDLGRNL